MNKIDIRGNVIEVGGIIFADPQSNYTASEIRQCDQDMDRIQVLDCDGDDARYISFGDIDNLIVALQKAKELWITQNEQD